jgi:hypothetical protein
MACTKNTKKYPVRSRVIASKLIFFTGGTIVFSFFFENLCTNIKYVDAHGKLHGKFYFTIF